MRDTIGSLRIKDPVYIPGLGMLFWQMTHHSSSYTDEIDFLSPKYIPNWVSHYAVPKRNNILEVGFQYFFLDLILARQLDRGVYNEVHMYYDPFSETYKKEYYVLLNDNATLEDMSLPRKLILALQNILVNLNGESMTCRYYNYDITDDPMRVEIEFMHCETEGISPDVLLLTIGSILNS